MAKSVIIGADHGGFNLKEKIKGALRRARYSVKDVGTDSEESCDYPQIGFDVARAVSEKKFARGIVICKTGIGMAIAANKFPGVRAGVCSTAADALSSRQHNDTNVLVLAATKLSDRKALEILRVWLKTKSLGGRHRRRVRQIEKMERKLYEAFKKRGS